MTAATAVTCGFSAWHYQHGSLHCELPAGHDRMHGYWITPTVLKRWEVSL